jgi:hypothetical protein
LKDHLAFIIVFDFFITLLIEHETEIFVSFYLSKPTGGGAPSTLPLYHGGERGVRWQDSEAVAEVRRRRCQGTEDFLGHRCACEKCFAGDSRSASTFRRELPRVDLAVDNMKRTDCCSVRTGTDLDI